MTVVQKGEIFCDLCYMIYTKVAILLISLVLLGHCGLGLSNESKILLKSQYGKLPEVAKVQKIPNSSRRTDTSLKKDWQK